MATSVQSSVFFLKRKPLYETERVYELDIEPPPGFPRTNMEHEKVNDVVIEDIRGQEQNFTFCNNGFSLINLNGGITYEDFNDADKIEKIYLKNVASKIKSELGAARVQIFDYNVSADSGDPASRERRDN
jgi:hypothetical protein